MATNKKEVPCEFCGWTDHESLDCKIAFVFEEDPKSYSSSEWKTMCDKADRQVIHSLYLEGEKRHGDCA